MSILPRCTCLKKGGPMEPPCPQHGHTLEHFAHEQGQGEAGSLPAGASGPETESDPLEELRYIADKYAYMSSPIGRLGVCADAWEKERGRDAGNPGKPVSSPAREPLTLFDGRE